MKKKIAVIVLAAGKGERMKSAVPKVLHPVCGRVMIEYVQDLTDKLKAGPVIYVLGHKHQEVRKFLKPGSKVAIQKRLSGTADAIKEALPALRNFKGCVLVLYGDAPLLTKETVRKLLDTHLKNNLDATLLTAQMDKPAGYGRILRDRYNTVCGIVEDKDADAFQKSIQEINTGIICFDKEKLSAALSEVRPDNRKKEYYLTDVVGIFYKKGYLLDSVRATDIQEAMGINSRVELAKASAVMRRRINEEHMKSGVTITDGDSAYIDYGVKIGQDSVIYPFTVIEKDVKIGKRCQVGPFVHLRSGTRLRDDVLIGNFLEIVRSEISSNTLAKHFAYIGDSRIGNYVNIGAGTVTANFDGRKKNITVVKDKAFIGSDTVLVAPVEIGKGAITGAGSVVTKNKKVADYTVVAGVPARLIKKMR